MKALPMYRITVVGEFECCIIIYVDMVVNTFTQMKWCKNDGETNVEFRDDMLIPDSDDHVGSVIQETYPELTL